MSNTAPTPPPAGPTLAARAAAEALGTFVLVFVLIGAALLTSPNSSGAGTQPGTGLLGVALALGIAVTIGGYVFGSVSGGHFNPAVSVGVAIAGNLRWRLVPVYVAAQFVGAIVGAAAVFALVSGGHPAFASRAISSGFASNGYGTHSPGGFGVVPTATVEIIATAILVLVALTVSTAAANSLPAALAVGLTLTGMLLVALPIDNASLNPARSLATAIFAGGAWLGQLWAFIVFPLVGAAIGGVIHRYVLAPAIAERRKGVPTTTS